MPTTETLRVVSWNVNGLRSVATKGFDRWLDRSGAEIVGLQETRCLPEQLPPKLATPRGWHLTLTPAEQKGYSGVGCYSRTPPDAVETTLGQERFDREGRLQVLRFGRLVVANAYFPNGNGKDRDHSRIPYKLDFYRALFDRLEPMRAAGEAVLVMGDFNTAHRAIDLARPKSNEKTSGFTPVERDELDRWLHGGWTDTFRAFCDAPEKYSWWSNRAGVRERNIGWRIDYVLASAGAMEHVRDAFIHDHVMGSDHCPVGVDLDRAVLGSDD